MCDLLGCVCVQVVTAVVTTVRQRFPGAASTLAPPAVAGQGPKPPGAPLPGQGGERPKHPSRASQGPEPFAPASPQALSLKESEKTALSEKLMGTRHSLAAVSLEMERQKRDAQNRKEQDRVGRTGLGRA